MTVDATAVRRSPWQAFRAWFRTLPLRWTLVAALVGLCAVGLVVSGASVTTALQNSMTTRIDSELTDAAHTWARPHGGPPPAPMPSSPSSSRPPSTYFVRITGADGEVRFTVNDSASAPDLADLPDGGGPVTVDSDGAGPQWRVLTTTDPSGDQVVVAKSLDDVESTVSRLVALQVAIGVVVLLALGVLGGFLVRRSLRPLGEIEQTAAAIAAGDLHQRVPERHPRTEVGSLSTSLNGMLGRIQRAVAASADAEEAARGSAATARASEQRMRRFIADAGHELRTPLTTIRGFAELHRMGGTDDAASVIGHIERESARMGLLVEDLLTLAALDAQRPLERLPVDLFAVAADAVAAARAVAPQRRITLDLDGGAGAPEVLGDASRLRQVFDNLLSNARMHTPDDARIDVRVHGAEDGWVRATVADTGPGLSPEDRERVFERFYRTDASRARVSGGNGLGLSIVASLVRGHGGEVSVASEPGRGAAFTVRLPQWEPGTLPAGPQADADTPAETSGDGA